MKRLILPGILSLLSVCIYSQADPEAVKILDKFSATALSAPSVSIKFRLINIDLAENSRDTVKGTLLMYKDQYRLELPDNISWFNGTISWNLLVKEKEVTITKPDRKDDSFFSMPSSIFSLYKKGYKTRLIADNPKSWIIDLYPEDTESDILRIRLIIGKESYNLINAEYRKKTGLVIDLIADKYDLTIKPETGAFTFDAKKYKDAEIIDMR